ncbi:MAG: POTRA domain-containing protein, partial [Planctomycetota bacterium]
GNRSIPTHQILQKVSTRPGRFFDPAALQNDVDNLWQMPTIERIEGPFLDKTPQGVIVTFEVVERDSIQEVKFVGNRGITDKVLKKTLDIKDGDPLDVHQIRMAKSRIEDLYREKGYPRTQVEILEGSQDGDQSVVFLIHEDEKQRIWRVEFEGNTIASDGRLKHFVESKPGILKVFGGLVNRTEIDQDVVRLTSYYRSLGFFNARIGREVSESNDGRWLTIRYIINEGPRYRVRNVSFIGNAAYNNQQLLDMLDFKPTQEEPNPEFNVAKMNQDVRSLRDLYGSQGFVFAKVEAEPRFLEEPGLLDLVYKVEEDKQYYVGDINVHFQGDFGITKKSVILGRLGLRPGDLVDAREIRNGERRLRSAQIFAGANPGESAPKVVLRPAELKELERFAEGPAGRSYR